MKVNFMFVLAILLLPVIAFAAVAVKDDGTYQGEATEIDFVDSTVTWDGSKATVDSSVAATGTITTLGSTTATITTANITTGYIGAISQSGNNITLLGQALTVSGTDLYWAGKKMSN